MKVVVTGGAGFIGANLVREFLRDSETEVVVVDDLSTGFRSNLDGLERVELVVGSILDREVMAAAADGARAIVHLAARPSVPRSLADPEASHEVNATGTVRVLEAARRAGNVQTIVASSSSVYGANPHLPKHEDLQTMPVSPYAVSKLATEAYALSYSRCFDLPVLPFRFFNVFGPLQAAGHAYAAVIPAFLDAALAGRPLTVHGDGRQTRDFTYVGTVARVLAEAVRRGIHTDTPVNLAFGSRRTLLDVIDIMTGLLGAPIAAEHTAPRPGDVRDSQADSSRLGRLFPEVEAVPFEQGLAETIAWFRTGDVTTTNVPAAVIA